MKLPPHWPLREYSTFIDVDDMQWHYQRLGAGPALLLLHGTGASSHSFAPLAERLATHYELLIPDLPGQGFSSSLPEAETSMAGFSARLSRLLAATEFHPDYAVGHSAGAAVLAWMTLDQLLPLHGLISLNGAFLPFGSVAAPLFSRTASLLSRSRIMAWVTAAHGVFERPIRNLISETGSHPTPEMLACYQQLLRRPEHISGTLRMMAGWRLDLLKERLPSMPTPMHLVVCENDRTVPNWQSERLAELIHRADLHRVPDLGHLGHEEQPDTFATLISRLCTG